MHTLGICSLSLSADRILSFKITYLSLKCVHWSLKFICTMDWMFVRSPTPNHVCSSPDRLPPTPRPMSWNLEMGTLKVIRVRLLLTSTLMMGLVALRGREWGRALYIHWGEAMWVHRDKVTVRKEGKKLSPEHKHVCTPISDFQPQNGEARSLVHLVYRYFFVTIQAKTSDRS